MRKGLFTILLSVIAVIGFSFLMNEEEQPGRKNSKRQSKERLFDGRNMKFNRETKETAIIFQMAPLDSVKLACPDCERLMPATPDENKGSLMIYLRSKDEERQLDPSMLDKWVKIKSSSGKVALVFKRDGFGEKILSIRQLRFWRLTRSKFRDIEGVPSTILDVNNVFVDKLVQEESEEQMNFSVSLRKEDQIRVSIKGVYGTLPENVVCNIYKKGEEFDKTPVEVGVPFPAPKIDGGRDEFFFEFAHIDGVKGVNTYHVDVERIPAHSTGYLDIDADTLDLDTLSGDTVAEEVDPFLKYLELMQGEPDFTCTTPETKFVESIGGRFILSANQECKQCFDLELTDECMAAAECVGCESIWAFWIGAGENMINRYNFKDSTRRLASGDGLIEAWTRSRKTIFPEEYYGENIFFAIVDSEEKNRFLNEPFDRYAWPGDYSYTISENRFLNSFSFIMKYSPERPVALCLYNDNTLTPVPVMFRFQQFLTEPRKTETQAVPVYNDGFSGDYIQ